MVFTAIIVASATNFADTFANIVAIVADDVRVDANVVARPPVVVGFVADDPDVKARSPDALGAMTDNFVVFTADFEASDTVDVGVLANVAAGFPNGVGVATDPPDASHF